MGLGGTAVESEGAKHGVTGDGVSTGCEAAAVLDEVVVAVGGTHAVTARAVGHDRVAHRELGIVVVYAPAEVGGAICGEGGVAHRANASAVFVYAPAVVGGAICGEGG